MLAPHVSKVRFSEAAMLPALWTSDTRSLPLGKALECVLLGPVESRVQVIPQEVSA